MFRRFFGNHRPFTVAQALVPAVSTLRRRCQSLTETLREWPVAETCVTEPRLVLPSRDCLTEPRVKGAVVLLSRDCLTEPRLKGAVVLLSRGYCY